MPFDIDSCYKLIQNYLKETPLILVGSGNSCACGIPGMSGIAQELVSKLDTDWIVNSKSDRFYKVRDLLNSAGDKYPSVPCKRMLLNQ